MILAPTLTLSAGSGAAIARPTFSRDFAGEKTLNNGTGPAITFTRASGATFFDVNGTLQTAANNVARFDHNPSNGQSRGLLIEPARTNLLLNSASPSTQTVAITSAAHTISFYGTGSIVLSGAHSATVVGAGAFPARTSLRFTQSAGSLTVTVSGTVEYAQLEVGDFATSYIPTTTASATRSADLAVITPVTFYSESEGTLLAEAEMDTASNPSSGVLFAFDKNNNTDRVAVSGDSLGFAVLAIVSVGGVSQLGSQFDNLTIGAGIHKIALAYAENDIALKTTTLSLITDSSASLPTGITHARIGSNALGFYNTVHIRRIAYWPKRLTNTLLEQLTT